MTGKREPRNNIPKKYRHTEGEKVGLVHGFSSTIIAVKSFTLYTR